MNRRICARCGNWQQLSHNNLWGPWLRKPATPHQIKVGEDNVEFTVCPWCIRHMQGLQSRQVREERAR